MSMRITLLQSAPIEASVIESLEYACVNRECSKARLVRGLSVQTNAPTKADVSRQGPWLECRIPESQEKLMGAPAQKFARTSTVTIVTTALARKHLCTRHHGRQITCLAVSVMKATLDMIAL